MCRKVKCKHDIKGRERHKMIKISQSVLIMGGGSFVGTDKNPELFDD